MTEGLALIVGSGPRAVAIQDLPLAEVPLTGLVAVNNAWRLLDSYTHVIYPGDFPPDRRCPAEAPPLHVSVADYMPAINRAGGLLFGGATMALAAGYWAVDALLPKVLGFIGCDMVYRGKQTHFYGVGAADPLRDDISLRDLKARTTRLFAWALQQETLLVNLTGEPESNLTWPVASFAMARSLAAPSSFPRRQPEAWIRLLACAEDHFAYERQAPFDGAAEEYWKFQGVPEAERFNAEVGERWAALSPLVQQGWKDYIAGELAGEDGPEALAAIGDATHAT